MDCGRGGLEVSASCGFCLVPLRLNVKTVCSILEEPVMSSPGLRKGPLKINLLSPNLTFVWRDTTSPEDAQRTPFHEAPSCSFFTRSLNWAGRLWMEKPRYLKSSRRNSPSNSGSL